MSDQRRFSVESRPRIAGILETRRSPRLTGVPSKEATHLFGERESAQSIHMYSLVLLELFDNELRDVCPDGGDVVIRETPDCALLWFGVVTQHVYTTTEIEEQHSMSYFRNFTDLGYLRWVHQCLS